MSARAALAFVALLAAHAGDAPQATPRSPGIAGGGTPAPTAAATTAAAADLAAAAFRPDGPGVGTAAPARPRVEVTTAFQARELRVTARIVPGLPESVVRRLVSGLPTTSSWDIGLYSDRGLWPDGRKDSRRYDVTVTYRPATGDFSVERRLDDRLLETAVVPTRAEAMASLEHVLGLPCFVMQKHLDGKALVVKVRCAYATGVSLGVVPTTVETDRARSRSFVWSEPPR